MNRLIRLYLSTKNTFILLLVVFFIFWIGRSINGLDQKPQLVKQGSLEDDIDLNPIAHLDAEERQVLKRQHILNSLGAKNTGLKEKKNKEKEKKIKKGACPDYSDYSRIPHGPYSEGELALPFMRPVEECRTFKSEAIEKVILDFKERMKDLDLFRLFENCLPNTLDTTILWHDIDEETDLPLTFVVTGDIHAEWLRDSARQLSVYQKFAKYDSNLSRMIKGAIFQQAKFIIKAPYCNAFQPPSKSNLSRKESSIDDVFPRPPWRHVFECKYELDSLASFLTLTNEYFENTGDDSIFKNELWLKAYQTLLLILGRESLSTFDANGNLLPYQYSFQRSTKIGSETLPLAGVGNPVNYGTGLIRSAFRPSDDACIYQFFIPANAHMYTELVKIVEHLTDEDFVTTTQFYIDKIKSGIETYGITIHPKFGKVYAFEVDGYGGLNMMDDANIPSLLSLPDMGFLNKEDEIYQNTRKMVLSKEGNPYFSKGKYFKGIGGPHIGTGNAWPMSLLVAIRTSDDDAEIMSYLELIKSTTAGLGLMHESIAVNSPTNSFTRSWFAWCNSEFGKTILDLAERKPHLIFTNNEPYEYVV